MGWELKGRHLFQGKQTKRVLALLDETKRIYLLIERDWPTDHKALLQHFKAGHTANRARAQGNGGSQFLTVKMGGGILLGDLEVDGVVAGANQVSQRGQHLFSILQTPQKVSTIQLIQFFVIFIENKIYKNIYTNK
jgi:hypothetical protein